LQDGWAAVVVRWAGGSSSKQTRIVPCPRAIMRVVSLPRRQRRADRTEKAAPWIGDPSTKLKPGNCLPAGRPKAATAKCRAQNWARPGPASSAPRRTAGGGSRPQGSSRAQPISSRGPQSSRPDATAARIDARSCRYRGCFCW
jgi:hypothetical protein